MEFLPIPRPGRAGALAMLALAFLCATPGARAQDVARNVTGNEAAWLARLVCQGSYDLTPNRLVAERAKLGQGAMRLTFGLEAGSLTARLERAAGVAPWRDPELVRAFEPPARATELIVVKERFWFNGPGGAAYALRMAGERLAGSLDPQDMPQFRHQGLGQVRLTCRDQPRY